MNRRLGVHSPQNRLKKYVSAIAERRMEKRREGFWLLKSRGKALSAVCIAAALTVSGCSAMETYEPVGQHNETAETPAGTDQIPETEKAESANIKLNLSENRPEQDVDKGEEESRSKRATLVFAGDILFDDSYAIMASLNQRGQGIAGGISSDLLEEMRGADLCIVNNEFPYTDRGTPTPDKKFTFRAKPKYASYLLDMGVDLATLANNHASDYGEVSLTDTLDTLTDLKIAYAGAGRNLEEASRPVYLEAGGIRIGFLAATQIERMENPSTKGATENSPGVFRCLDLTRLLERIAEAKENCDYVVVCIHWGTESTDVIDHWQTEQAPQIAAAGADLIIGAHPHVLQPIGYCGETPVVYSMGNFLFNSKSLDSCLIKVVLNEEGLESLQFLAAKQAGCRVSMAEGSEKERILQYMRSISDEVLIDENGYVTRK